MLQLSIENISMKFDELHQLKANNWKKMDSIDKKVRNLYQTILLYSIYLLLFSYIIKIQPWGLYNLLSTNRIEP